MNVTPKILLATTNSNAILANLPQPMPFSFVFLNNFVKKSTQDTKAVNVLTFIALCINPAPFSKSISKYKPKHTHSDLGKHSYGIF